MRHPDLIQHTGRLPPYVWRNGIQYFSMPELAKRRRISRWGAAKWCRAHPDMCITHNGHVYGRLIDRGSG